MQWLELQNLFFLLIIPIILILYLLKKNYEDQEISSILLWRQLILDIEANRWWKRLQKNILLFLQLLFAILVIFALLKPIFPTNQLIANHSIIIMDNSASMLTKEQDTTRFQLAKEEIYNRIDSISSNQSITLILAEEKPKVLISKSSNKDQLKEAIKEVPINYGSTDDSAALSFAQSIAMTEIDTGILWISDGANQSFMESDRLVEPIPFEHLLIGSMRENVAITSFVTQETSNEIQGMIKIDNTGSNIKVAKISIYNAEDQLLDVNSFEIKGKSTYSYLIKALPQSSYYYGVLDVEGDPLEQDNLLYSVSYKSKERTGILITEGNRFLHQGLGLLQNFQLSTTNQNQITNQIREHTDIWVYDSVTPTKLPEGNLLLFAPKESTPWFSYFGEKEVQGTPQIVNEAHSINQHVPWDQVYINKIIKLDNLKGFEPLVQLGDETIISAGIIDGRKIIIAHFALQQSDMPLRPAFPIFLQNAVQWLTPIQSLPIGIAKADQVITIPFMAGSSNRKVILPSREEELIVEDQGLNQLYRVPNQIGLYQVSEKRESEELNRFFTVSMNEEESVIAPKMISIPVIGLNNENKEDEKIEKKNIGYQDLTFWFVWFALLVLMIEGFFYYRGYE